VSAGPRLDWSCESRNQLLNTGPVWQKFCFVRATGDFLHYA
jgi:hypothetical protein